MLLRLTLRRLMAAALLGLFCSLPAVAAPLRLGVQPNTVKKFEVLAAYFAAKGQAVDLIPYSNNDAAVEMAKKGQLDAVIAGSGLGATLINGGIGTPLVRPIDKLGRSTYWAVILAAKGSKPFNDSASYFNGKRVAFPSLASSGEFFYRAIPGIKGVNATVKEAATHQDAIDQLSKGEIDLAIVKNIAWASVKAKYPGLVEVGSDGGQNPNDTLLVTKQLSTAQSGKLMAILLGVGKDSSDAALKLKEGLGILEYTVTTVNDFNHTFDLMRRAGALR